MVRTERKAEHKPPPIEHTSHIRKTPEKLSSVLNNCTLRDITHLLDPNKRNSSDSDTKPQNYLFVKFTYTSIFILTHLYTIDHARITGYLRNDDPIKQ